MSVRYVEHDICTYRVRFIVNGYPVKMYCYNEGDLRNKVEEAIYTYSDFRISQDRPQILRFLTVMALLGYEI